jgi:predicted permease
MRTLIDHVQGDIRFAVRSLRRAPGFAAVVITTLALGVGVLTATFSFVYSFYWRPLPFTGIDRMVAVGEVRPNGFCCRAEVSKSVGAIVARTNQSFVRTTRYESGYYNTLIGDTALALTTLLIDTSFAPTFQLHPQLGRFFTQHDADAHTPVAVISDRLWRTAFNRDSTVIGRRVAFDASELTIVGVMPAGFGFPWRTDTWLPRSDSRDAMAKSDMDFDVGFIGTLRPGVSRATAAAELRAISAKLATDTAIGPSKVQVRALPEILDRKAEEGAPMPSLFLSAGALVLLIAAANVANLFLARTVERKGEIAIRSSIGATRGRLIRQLLTETFLLVLLAGVLGIVGASGLTTLAAHAYPGDGMPAWLRFGIDDKVLMFVLGIVALVSVVVGLTPALEGTGYEITKTLKAGGDGGSVRTGVARAARRGLVIQLALSIVLFVGTVMCVRSYQRISLANLGYPGDHVVDASYFLGDQNIAPATRLALATDISTRLRALGNGIQTAVRGLAIERPLVAAHKSSTSDPKAYDWRLIPDHDTTRALQRRDLRASQELAVSDSYFGTLGLKLLHGRTFTAADDSLSASTVVISERLASLLWPKGDAIGGELQRGRDGRPSKVIGVVQDVRDIVGGRAGTILLTRASAYYSVRQADAWNVETLARWNGSVSTLQAMVRKVIRDVNSRIVTRVGVLGNVAQFQTVTAVFGSVIGIFAATGIFLAVIGLYGLVAYGVTQRRREIGVRLALGATYKNVVTMIVADAMRFVAIGIVTGLILSVAAGQLLRVLIFEASRVDPTVYLIASLTFAAIALLATYVPALRATRIEPMIALKSE